MATLSPSAGFVLKLILLTLYLSLAVKGINLPEEWVHALNLIVQKQEKEMTGIVDVHCLTRSTGENRVSRVILS